MKRFVACLFALITATSGAEVHQGVVFPIKQVAVSSPVPQEIISRMLVKEGDTVKEGDVIAELRKEREELDVKLSEKAIELKRFIARGQQRLFKEEMGSETKALEAKADLELAEVQLEAKKLNLSEKTVRAPLSGTIVKKYKESGESITHQEKLVDIINHDIVNVRFYLPPNLRPALSLHGAVMVKVTDLGGAEFPSKITFIDPRNDAASGLVQVWVEIDNQAHRIAPGMKATASFGK
jgi:membrane fusion protein, multidrug efflux system